MWQLKRRLCVGLFIGFWGRYPARNAGVYWRSVSAPAPSHHVVIRPVTVSDAGSLGALHRSIYAEGRWFVGDGPPLAETLRGRIRTLVPTRSLYLVAAETGDLVGRSEVQGWLELHRLTPHKLEHVAVLTIAVGQPFRRQGLAGALLAHAYPWVREVGVLKIQLSVRAKNAAALSLYKREGFELEGRERNQVFDDGGFEDNLLMAKFL